MKTYFIGLGGCGLRTVAEIQKRLNREEPQNLKNDYAFTYIDTDINTFKEINPEGEISSADFKNLGDVVPLAIYEEAIKKEHPDDKTKRFLEWVISQENGHMVLPNYPLTDGATAQRNVGRCAIYYHYDVVEKELEKKLSRFSTLNTNAEGKRDVDVWVVASSCGGTGSSMILDVLYMVNRLAIPIANGEPNVKLVLYMPQTFVALNQTNINHKLNAFACLDEINCFRSNYENNHRNTFEAYAVQPTKNAKEPFAFPLFRYMIPVCSENNVGATMTDKQLYPTVANMVFLINTGKGAGSRRSDLSNQIVEVMQTSATNSDITSQMMGYGFREIKKANNELKEYLVKRALYEVFRYGLLDGNSISNFNEVMKKFANEAILSKLMTLQSPKVNDNETNQIIDYLIDLSNDSESLEARVKKYVNTATKFDSENINPDTIKSIDNKLNRMLQSVEFEDIEKDVYNQVKNSIDEKINDIILNYGLEIASNILNTVDDFYLEPLGRHIENKLKPDVNAKLKTAMSACKTYEKDGVKRKQRATAAQSLNKYKDAVAESIVLKIVGGIITQLTKYPHGYLEQLRKGDNDISGIKLLKRMLSDYCVDFKNDYSELSKKFRGTASDAMTIYLPSLVEMTMGENGNDWAEEDNIFDQLYHESILEQHEINTGLEQVKVPVRTSENSKGLKDLLESIGARVNNSNVFIKVIKSTKNNLPINIENKIIQPLKNIVQELSEDSNTAAGDWIGMGLSDAIHNRMLIPKVFDRKPAILFNSFKDVNRVPVFFPLKRGVNMPTNNKLMFVGESVNGELAELLGYDKNDRDQKFVEDKNMKDRFVIIRMPIGLDFTMYKYYKDYQGSYTDERYGNLVRSQFYGCHIHKAFNEYGPNLIQLTRGGNAGSKGVSKQLSENRIANLVRCLFYQHVVNIMFEKDKISYNKLFGYNTTGGLNIDLTKLTPEQRIFLGLSDDPTPVSADTRPKQFITLDLDMVKHIVKLRMRPVVIKAQTKNLEVTDKYSTFEFDKNHFDRCTAFVEQLLTIPSELFHVADFMEQKFKNDQNLREALERVKNEAKERLNDVSDTDIKFAMCYVLWEQYAGDSGEDANIVKSIENVISSL